MPVAQVKKQFTDECFWRTYFTTVEGLRLVRQPRTPLLPLLHAPV